MVKLNPIYRSVFATDKRYTIITGGRGSGKSFGVTTFASLLTYEVGHRVLFSRYTMTSAHLSIIPEFVEKIELLDAVNAFEVQAAEITNKATGSDILFRGIKTSSGNQTANLKSLNGVTTWILDEADELADEETFDKIDLSIRKEGAQNRVIIILNPTYKEHWIYKRFFQNHLRYIEVDGEQIESTTHPDVEHIHTTYLDNLDNLSESFLQIAQNTKRDNPQAYKSKFLGCWLDKVEGILFTRAELNYFTPSKTLEDSFESSIGYADIADEGSDYLACPIGRNVKEKIYITDLVFNNLNADITLPMVADMLIRNKVRYCRVESNSMGAMYGRNLQKVTKSTQILPAVSTTNKHTRILMDAWFIKKYCYFLDEQHQSPEYKAFIQQLVDYTNDGKSKHDDAPDALSGLVMFIRGMLGKYY